MGIVQAIPTFGYTTLKKILAKAKFDLRLEHTTTQDIYLQKYIVDCVPAMKTGLDILPQKAVLPIKDFTAKLPFNYIDLINDNLAPIIFTTNGIPDPSAYFNFFDYTYSGYGVFLINIIGSFEPYWGVPVIQIQNRYITFSNQITATECSIRYNGLNVDEEGDIKIPLTNEAPIVAGVKFKYKKDENMPPSSWLEDKREWTDGIKDRRGEAAKLNPFQQQRINYILNRMF